MIEAIIAALLGEATVNAITALRVRAFQLEEGDIDAGPCVCVNRIGGPVNNVLSGSSYVNPNIIQVDAYGLKRSQTKALADAVEAFLKTLSGSHSGIEIQAARLASAPQDLYETDTMAFRVCMQFEVWTQ